MLILQRKTVQAIKIGDAIEIVVLEVSGEHVRLGIDAPRDIRVLRHELLAELQAENRRAAQSPSREALAPLLGTLRAHS